MKNIGASAIYGRNSSISLQDGKIVYVFAIILYELLCICVETVAFNLLWDKGCEVCVQPIKHEM
jgi:hypothetical protein